jgi:hypothetical protein
LWTGQERKCVSSIKGAENYLERDKCKQQQLPNNFLILVLDGRSTNINGTKWLMEVKLSNNPDKFVWKLTEIGNFTVKSMYLDLMNGHTRVLYKYLWKL